MSRRSIRRHGSSAALAAASVAYWSFASSQSQLVGPFPRGHDDDPDDRRIALSFDDGPNEPFTSRLAELLEEYKIRATFFQVGCAVRREPDVSRALLTAGHVIGNHSYSHQLHRCIVPSLIADEVARAQDVIGETLGRRPRLYRPPWLVRTPATFRALAEYDLLAVSGTFCHPLEVASAGPRRIAARAVARARPGRVIIFHDGYHGGTADRSRTLDAVGLTIEALLGHGRQFVTVDELLRSRPYGRRPDCYDAGSTTR